LRLVTASYHMRRSLLELRRTLSKTQIITHPVFSSATKGYRWHFNLGGIMIVAKEFNKYVAPGIRLPVMSAELRESVQ